MYMCFETEHLDQEVTAPKKAFDLSLGTVRSSYLVGHALSVCEGWWPGLAVALAEKLFLDKLTCLFLMEKFQKVKLQASCFGKVIYVWKILDKGRTIDKSKMILTWKEISSENMVFGWLMWNHIWLTDVKLTWTGCWKFLEELTACLPPSSCWCAWWELLTGKALNTSTACFPVFPCLWLCLASNQEEVEYL